MTSILTRFQRRYHRSAARLFFRRPLTIRSDTPFISFTFDDFPRSALLSGGAILKSLGVAGTYYAALGLMGQKSDTGLIFVPEDLKRLIADGHELGSHTFNHCDSLTTKPSEFEAEIIRNEQALGKMWPELQASFRTLSYPISQPRARTKARAARYFVCSRGGGQTFNTGVTDLNLLSAYFLEKGRNDPAAVKRLIDETCRVRGWLIFATHDISESPTVFGCTPIFFEDIVRYAVKSGARILPVIQAWETLAQPVPKLDLK